MMKNIKEWNPQKDYSNYPIGEMYNMDFIAKWLIENRRYEPKTLSLKDYVLNIIEWIEFSNNKNHDTDSWIIIPNKGVVEQFFLNHKCEEFEIDGRWGLFNKTEE